MLNNVSDTIGMLPTINKPFRHTRLLYREFTRKIIEAYYEHPNIFNSVLWTTLSRQSWKDTLVNRKEPSKHVFGSRRFFRQQFFRLQIFRHIFSDTKFSETYFLTPNFPTHIFRHQIFRQTNFPKPLFPTTNFPKNIFSDNQNYFSIQRTNRNNAV